MGDILLAHRNHPMTANSSQHENAACMLSMIAPSGGAGNQSSINPLSIPLFRGAGTLQGQPQLTS